ncbi:MAG: hypothetical protein Q7S21_04870 [archaeon]|nr:hypothetical protein [archaeon]
MEKHKSKKTTKVKAKKTTKKRMNSGFALSILTKAAQKHKAMKTPSDKAITILQGQAKKYGFSVSEAEEMAKTAFGKR